MADDAPSAQEYELRIAKLEALVAQQAELIESQRQSVDRLEAIVAELQRQLGQSSGNSGTPPSRAPAAERQRQAEQRQRRDQAKGGAAKRRRGKQRGVKGNGLEMSSGAQPGHRLRRPPPPRPALHVRPASSASRTIKPRGTCGPRSCTGRSRVWTNPFSGGLRRRLRIDTPAGPEFFVVSRVKHVAPLLKTKLHR